MPFFNEGQGQLIQVKPQYLHLGYGYGISRELTGAFQLNDQMFLGQTPEGQFSQFIKQGGYIDLFRGFAQ